MPFIGELVQRIKQACPEALIAVVPKAKLGGNGVCGLETNAPDIVRQTVRVLFYNLEAVLPIFLIDSGGVRGADIVGLEKEHDVFDFLLRFPALLDPLHPQLAEPANLQKLVRLLLDDLQRVLPEGVYDQVRELWANPLDQTAAEIFLNAVYGSRQGLLKLGYGELPPVPGVHFPGSLQGQHAAGMNLRHIPDDSHKLRIALRPALQHGKARFRTLIGRALHNAS